MSQEKAELVTYMIDIMDEYFNPQTRICHEHNIHSCMTCARKLVDHAERRQIMDKITGDSMMEILHNVGERGKVSPTVVGVSPEPHDVIVYGDAGTGKSEIVAGLCAEMGHNVVILEDLDDDEKNAIIVGAGSVRPNINDIILHCSPIEMEAEDISYLDTRHHGKKKKKNKKLKDWEIHGRRKR